MDDNEKYLRLITSEYATQPMFTAFVEEFLNMLSPIVDCLESFNEIFNLETAVGDQLDQCGALLNMTRQLPIVDPDIPSILPDDLFRIVLQARIYANHWNGTTEGLIEIIKKTFPLASFELVDNQDMSMSLIMINPSASKAMVALLFRGYIIPKPEGVKVNYTVQDKALFGWDSETDFIKGWEEGIWGDG